MQKVYYVYILVDITTKAHHYTRVTEDLHDRFTKHNAGEVPHTSKFKLWHLTQRKKLLPLKDRGRSPKV